MSDYRKRYDEIAKSRWFREVYEGAPLGDELPVAVVAAVEHETVKLRAEVERLNKFREALDQYGRCESTCARRDGEDHCSCGLEALLEDGA